MASDHTWSDQFSIPATIYHDKHQPTIRLRCARLGLPGRFEQSTEEIEQLMARGGSKRRKVKRHFIAIDRFRKDERASDRRRAEARRPFRTAVPDDETGD